MVNSFSSTLGETQTDCSSGRSMIGGRESLLLQEKSSSAVCSLLEADLLKNVLLAKYHHTGNERPENTFPAPK